MKKQIDWKTLIGLDTPASSLHEQILSGIGGVIGIYCVFVISGLYYENFDHVLIVASMGATAVLLFAIPHVPVAQPWNTFAGHTLSAIVGVSCAKWVADPYLAGALAVGLAITVMHLCKCIHPPGGASALVAVVGGAGVHEAGYLYVIQPVMINAAVILCVGVAFNYLFPWRRYPAALAVDDSGGQGDRQATYDDISHADLVVALSQIDSFLDVSEQDLLRIYELATRHRRRQ